MYDILADFDFDYCHGILYRLRVLALVFYDVLFTCYFFSVVCLFPGIYAGFFFSVHLFFASYVHSPALYADPVSSVHLFFASYVHSPALYADPVSSVHFSRIFARTSPLILRSGLFSL